MALFNITIEKVIIQHEDAEILKQLHLITNKINKMSAELDAIKTELAAQSAKYDEIITSVDGIALDVTALKDKIALLSSGATAAEIAELAALVNAASAKIDPIRTATATLDAATDPTNV